MSEHPVEKASTTEGLPVSMSLGPTLEVLHVPAHSTLVDRRVVFLCGLAIVLGVIAAFVAQLLVRLIWLCTNISFHGNFSIAPGTPWDHHLGIFVIAIPVIGGVIVGWMARYGSKAIRGHGIPEAMEQVLTNQSRIPARMTFLKPLSAAVAIGTGGPFGAEGPIIATGGAIGSLLGQILKTTATERKTLLAAGAAAGMAATFGAPVSAVLLAVELLLFEFRPRSLVPVALAAVAAAGVRAGLEGTQPVFEMSNLLPLTTSAMAAYLLLGAIVGFFAMLVTRAVYLVEDLFDLLPIHWMWWPAIGGVVVGVVGYFFPRTLGVGYLNITDIINNNLTLQVVIILCVMKFISWAIALGSGTSGGTLAPLFTIGSGLGALLGFIGTKLWPGAGIDVRVAALVGMAAIFAGASRAMLASAVFAFETTLQPLGLLPLLGGCTASFLVSCLLMPHTIMTEKIARRGVRVPSEYSPDVWDQILVGDVALKPVVTLGGDQTLLEARTWIVSGSIGTSHQGFAVIGPSGSLLGVVTRRDLLNPDTPGEKRVREVLRREPIVVYAESTLRAAADEMIDHDIGRLPVVSRDNPPRVIGMITRSDLLKAQRPRLMEDR